YINTADVNRVAPFYWGGFYLVGDPEPIQFANNNWRYWILGIGFSLLLLGLFYFINKKKR
ncbi:LPXTG cell wall anchor domain-containing protein, partial [Aquimarina spongiae]